MYEQYKNSREKDIDEVFGNDIGSFDKWKSEYIEKYKKMIERQKEQALKALLSSKNLSKDLTGVGETYYHYKTKVKHSGFDLKINGITVASGKYRKKQNSDKLFVSLRIYDEKGYYYTLNDIEYPLFSPEIVLDEIIKKKPFYEYILKGKPQPKPDKAKSTESVKKEYKDEQERIIFEEGREGWLELEDKINNYKKGDRIVIKRKDGSIKAVMTNSANKKGKYQITFFDENNEPISDSTRETLKEVMAIMKEQLPQRPDVNVAAMLGEKAEYYYDMRLRPPDIGTYPEEGKVRIDYPEGVRYGRLVYDKMLSQKEIDKYELEPIGFKVINKESKGDQNTKNTIESIKSSAKFIIEVAKGDRKFKKKEIEEILQFIKDQNFHLEAKQINNKELKDDLKKANELVETAKNSIYNFKKRSTESVKKAIADILQSKNLQGTQTAVTLQDLQTQLGVTKDELVSMLESIDVAEAKLELGYSRDAKNKYYGDYSTITDYGVEQKKSEPKKEGLTKEEADLYTRRTTLEFTRRALFLQGGKPKQSEINEIDDELDILNDKIFELEKKQEKSKAQKKTEEVKEEIDYSLFEELSPESKKETRELELGKFLFDKIVKENKLSSKDMNDILKLYIDSVKERGYTMYSASLLGDVYRNITGTDDLMGLIREFDNVYNKKPEPKKQQPKKEEPKQQPIRMESRFGKESYKGSNTDTVAKIFTRMLGKNVAKVKMNPLKDSFRIVLKDGKTIDVNISKDKIEIIDNIKVAGRYQSVSSSTSFQALIDIADNYNKGNFTAYHEAFHLFYELFLTNSEKTILGTQFKDEESMADAFGEWAMNRDKRGAVKVVFEKLYNRMIDFIASVFGVSRAMTADSIFRGIYEGKYDVMNSFEQDMFGDKYSVEGLSTEDETVIKETKQIKNLKAQNEIMNKLAGVRLKLAEFKQKIDSKVESVKDEFNTQRDEIRAKYNADLLSEYDKAVQDIKALRESYREQKIDDKEQLDSEIKAIRDKVSEQAKTEYKNYQKELYKAQRKYDKKSGLYDMKKEALTFIKSVFGDVKGELSNKDKRTYKFSELEYRVKRARSGLGVIKAFNKYMQGLEEVNNKAISKAVDKMLKVKGKSDMAKAVKDITANIRSIMSLTEEELADKRIALELKLETEEDEAKVTEIKAEISELMTFGNFANKTANEKLIALAHINYAIKYGKMVFKARLEAQKAMYAQAREMYIDWLKLPEEDYYTTLFPSQAKREIEKRQKQRFSVMNFLGNAGKYVTTLSTIFDIIDQEVHTGKFYNSIFKDVLVRAQHNKDKVLNQWEDFLAEGYKNSGLKDGSKYPVLEQFKEKKQHIEHSAIKKNDITLHFENKEGQTLDTTEKFSDMELVSLYCMYNDDDQRKSMVNAGFTDESYNELMDIFESKPELLKFGEFLRYDFFPAYGMTVAEVYRRVEGHDLSLIEDYFPKQVEQDQGLKTDDNKYEFTGVSKVRNQHLISRIGSTRAVNLNVDAWETVMNHIHDMEHYKAFAEVGEYLRNTIGSQKFLQALSLSDRIGINSAYMSGKQVADALKEHLKGIISGVTKEYKTKRYESFFDKLIRRNRFAYTTSVLLANFASAAKQVTSAPLVVAYSDDPVKTVKEMMKFFYSKNSAEAYKKMSEIPELMRRYKKGLMNVEMKNVYADTEKLKTALGSSYTAFVDTAIHFGNLSAVGDKIAVLWGGYSLYKSQYEYYIKNGMSEKEADTKAKQDWVRVVNETMQSGESLYTSAYQRQQGLSGMISMFQSQANLLWNMNIQITTALSNIYQKRPDIRKRITYRALQNAVAMTTSMMLYAFIASGGRLPDDDEKWREWLGEAIAEFSIKPMPFIGRELGLLYKSIVTRKSPKYYEFFNMPIIEAWKKTALQLVRFGKDAYRDRLELENYYDLLASFNSLFFGVPLGVFKRNIMGAEEFIDDPNMRNFAKMLGWTDSALDVARED